MYWVEVWINPIVKEKKKCLQLIERTVSVSGWGEKRGVLKKEKISCERGSTQNGVSLKALALAEGAGWRKGEAEHE